MRTIFIFSVATVLGVMAVTIGGEDDCPSLYNRLWPDGPCATAYGLHQTSWEDAKHFCNSIFGELMVIDDINFYIDLVHYFQETGIRTDFWIGGRKTQDGNWTWIDDTAMAMGVPFWTVKPYNCRYSDCDLTLAPYLSSSNSKELCATLSSTYFYYFNNEDCTKKLSPLCIYTGIKRPSWEDPAEFAWSQAWRDDTQ